MVEKLRGTNMEIWHERDVRLSVDDAPRKIANRPMCWLSDPLLKSMRWKETIDLFSVHLVGLVQVNINIPENQNYTVVFNESRKKVIEGGGLIVGRWISIWIMVAWWDLVSKQWKQCYIADFSKGARSKGSRDSCQFRFESK